MQRILLASASALAFLAAVPALAQSNGSIVTQTGTDANATVTQSGASASSTSSSRHASSPR